MWKNFFKKENKHIDIKELYLLVFNELEDQNKYNIIIDHLNNCYHCNFEYIRLKREVNFLINNKDFIDNIYIKSNVKTIFNKELAFYLASILLILGIFFINYFRNDIYKEKMDTLELINLYDKISLIDNNSIENNSDKFLSYDYYEYLLYDFENFYEIN
ncbi:MAG: hypothetical protein ACP5O4_05265 [bacterium]|jgi:hypothetical protein